jgi:serine-type D-Ala-D-Ala carboxypeptidase/endopeptidase (penicillin-binding protein 4)
MLPVLGVNGSIANVCEDCPAKGKVFAKTGSVGLPAFVKPVEIEAESLGGYMEVNRHRSHQARRGLARRPIRVNNDIP